MTVPRRPPEIEVEAERVTGERDFERDPLTPAEEAERDRWLVEHDPSEDELQAAIDDAADRAEAIE